MVTKPAYLHYKKIWFLWQQDLPQYVDILLQKVFCGNVENCYKVATDSPLQKAFVANLVLLRIM